MPKYVIERTLPGAGKLSAEELRAISRTSNATLKEMGEPYHWIETYVTGDKMYCVHVAPDEATVREHAARAGFPVDSVAEVATVIDATTADG